MGIKLFKHEALLDFKYVIRLYGSNSDGEASHFVGAMMLKKMYPLIYRGPFGVQ